jgi:hypothetical protein
LKPALLLAALWLASACAHSPFSRGPRPNTEADTLYWKAIAAINPASADRSLDSAIVYLDRYLASPGPLRHNSEALVLRRLAQESMQLARVEAALIVRTDTVEVRTRTEAPPKRDEAAIREIQRLKEELAKANEELDRIRKRLATPPPTKPPN